MRPPRSLPRSWLSLRVVVALASGAVTGAPSGLVGAATKVFRQSSARDFEEGEARGTTILPDGEIVPGLRTIRFGVEAAFVWCSTPSRDGKTVYFGTADDGKIVAVSAGAAEPATTRVVGKLGVPWVSALSARADGRLLAAGNPGGGLVLVDPARGTRTDLARVPAAHVWAIADDERARRTYVATGIPGKIFVVDAAGQVRALWDAHDAHVLALVREADGSLLAGTSEAAILYRVSAAGAAEAIHDFEADEVRAIVRAPSGLYVAVNDFEGAPGAISPGPAASPIGAKGTKIVPPATPAGGSGGGSSNGNATTGSSAPAMAAAGSTGLLPRPGLRKSKAAVYRIDTAGRVEQVFALAEGYLTSLAVAPDGSIFAASGAQGRVHRIQPDGTSSLVVDVPERQILTLSSGAGAGGGAAGGSAGMALWLGAGDAAAVYAARPADGPGADSGRYLSRVLDADALADWGALHWRGSHVGFETRAGNTAKPDGTWRPWRPLRAVPEPPPGEDRGGGVGHVEEAPAPAGATGSASPAHHPARYLQYRATLRGPDARLREVAVYVMPQNQRPRLTQISLSDPGAGAGSSSGLGLGLGSLSGGTSTSGAAGVATRSPHTPVLKLRWKVDNDDGDELVYRVAVRPLDGAVWRPLAGMGGTTGDPLTKAELDWNTEAIPDGRYVVRVTASDERSQPAERALSSFLDSQPLLVDNRKPEVLAVTVRYPTISGRIEDLASPITEIAMAVDGGEWRLLSPSDGIADEKVESFAVALPRLSRGPHAVAIRASDSNDNLGALQLEVMAP